MRYTFEGYVLDPERRELTRGSDAIAVGPQVLDLLLYLVQNREHVVSKDELLDVVWSGRIGGRLLAHSGGRRGIPVCFGFQADQPNGERVTDFK